MPPSLWLLKPQQRQWKKQWDCPLHDGVMPFVTSPLAKFHIFIMVKSTNSVISVPRQSNNQLTPPTLPVTYKPTEAGKSGGCLFFDAVMQFSHLRLQNSILLQWMNPHISMTVQCLSLLWLTKHQKTLSKSSEIVQFWDSYNVSHLTTRKFLCCCNGGICQQRYLIPHASKSRLSPSITLAILTPLDTVTKMTRLFNLWRIYDIC